MGTSRRATSAGVLIWCSVATLLLAGTVAPAEQPTNLGDAKNAARAYYESGEYQKDIAEVINAAAAWITIRAPQVNMPAIVLDIDETALSNWQAIAANDFGRVYRGPCEDAKRGPCGLGAWNESAAAPAIPETLALYQHARLNGVAVFFVTGRLESQRPATLQNLHAAGYADIAYVFMKPPISPRPSNADYKPLARVAIEDQGYTIIANVGDQDSDLSGGHAEMSFLLPNPFYRTR